MGPMVGDWRPGFEALWGDRLRPLMGKGDLPGHPFRGNQYREAAEAAGKAWESAKAEGARARKAGTAEAHHKAMSAWQTAADAHQALAEGLTRAGVGPEHAKMHAQRAAEAEREMRVQARVASAKGAGVHRGRGVGAGGVDPKTGKGQGRL